MCTFSLGHSILSKKKFPFHIAVMRKSVSTYITLTNVTSLRTIYNITSQDEILKRTHNIVYRIHTIYMEYIHTRQTLILYSCILHFPRFYAFFHSSSQIPTRRMLHIPRLYVSQLYIVPEFPLYFPSSNCRMCPSLFTCHSFLLRLVIGVWHGKPSNISLQSPQTEICSSS
jgi:hypothetical protein